VIASRCLARYHISVPMQLSKKCNVYGGQIARQYVYCTRPRGHFGQHGAAPGGELVTWDGSVQNAAPDRVPWWRRALRWMVL
jgi:hypothetical protein